MILQLCMAAVLARVLGVKEFGSYVFFISTAQILTTVAMLGGQQLVVREIAAYRAKKKFTYMRGLIRRTNQAILIVSLLLITFSAVIGFHLYENNKLNNIFAYSIALTLVPFQAFMQVHAAALRGLQYILLGQLFNVIRPVIVLILVGILTLILRLSFSAAHAVFIQSIVTLIIAVFIFIILQRMMPHEEKTLPPKFETLRWSKSAFPFLIAGAIQIFTNEISLILLGILQNSEAVGLYRVAQRGSAIISFGLMAVNMSIGPTISELYAKGKKNQLQRIITKSVNAALFYALPIFSECFF